MGTGFKTFLSAGLILAASAMYAQTALLETAKQLYDAKKYEECAKAIEKEAERPDASTELLRLAMNANLRAGRPMSASIAGGNLLKKLKKPTRDVLYNAAEAARLAGDEKMALSRFHMFCLRPGAEKDSRFLGAAAYLLSRGRYPDVFMLYAKKVGPESTTDEAIANGRWLVDTSNVTGLVPYIPFLAETYVSNPSVMYALTEHLNRNRNRVSNGQYQIAEALVSCTLPKGMDNGHLFDFIKGIPDLDAMKRFRLGEKYVEYNGVPSDSGIFVIPGMQYVNTRQFAENKTAAAREFFVKHTEYLKTRNASAVRELLNNLSQADAKIFSFVKAEQLAKLTNHLYKLQASKFSDPDLSSIIGNIARKFYKDRKADAVDYLRAVIPSMNAASANLLFEMDLSGSTAAGEKNNVTKYLNVPGKDASKFETLHRGIGVYKALRENKRKAEFKNAVTAMVALGYYEPNELAQQLSGAGVTASDAVQMVLEGARLSGSNGTLQKLVKAMSASKTLSADPAFASLESFAKSGKGSDQVLTSAAAFLASEKSVSESEPLVSTFLKTYKGKVPSLAKQSDSMQEYAAFLVMRRVFENAHNKDFASRMVKAFMNRMKLPGDMFDILLWRAQWVDGSNKSGGLYYQTASEAIPMYAANPDANFNSLFCRANINPKGKDVSLLAPMYKTHASDSIYYLNENAACWTSPFYFREIEKFLDANGDSLSIYNMELLWNTVVRQDNPHRKALPASVLQKFLMMYDAACAKIKSYQPRMEANILAQAAEKDRGAMLNVYAGILAKRSPACVVAAVDMLSCTSISSWALDVIIPFYDKVLAPAIAKGYLKGDSGAQIRAQTIAVLSRVNADKNVSQALKDQAGKLIKTFADGIFAQDVLLNKDASATVCQNLAAELGHFLSANEASPLLVSRASMSLAEVLATETAAWRGTKAAADGWAALKDLPYPQIQYAYLTSFSSGTNQFQQEMKNTYMMQISALAKSIPGMIPVDKKDPAYRLYEAVNYRREGNALHAWALTREKLAVLAQRWKEFDFDFVLWALDMARTQKMYKEAVELAATLWLDESKLTPEYAARLALIKGDIYRDQKNYPIARLEYESLKNSPRCGKTEAGRMAKFRLVELLILTEDYSSARTMLEQLVDAPQVEDQAEAYFLLAKLEYSNNEYEQTLENLKEVFQRIHSHVEGRLLEAVVKLKLGRVGDDEVAIGTEKLATVQIPGRNLDLLIVDQNLGVIRGGESLPVLVTTSKGKDREIINLLPSATDMNKFSASVPTVLGKAVPGNGQIELCGDDIIEYEIEPEFQKANRISRPANKKDIRSAGKLYASSQPILSQEAQDDINFQREMLIAAGRSGAAVRSTGSTVRPGNPIYLRVIDPDMSRNTDKPDTLKVDLVCNSGDELSGFILTETGNSTGIFEGKVKTGIPFPNVNVSSSPEGQDVNAVINSTKKGSWTSNPSIRTRPQWLEVDTMTSMQFKTIKMEMVNPDSVKSLKLYASLDDTNDLLCSYPASKQEKVRGGLMMYTADSRSNQISEKSLASLFAKKNEGVWLRNPVSYRKYSNSRFNERDGWVATMITGYFYIPQNMVVEFKFLQLPNDRQVCFALVDKEPLLGGQMNAAGAVTTRVVQLQKGIHQLTIYGNDYARLSSIQLGYVKEDGSSAPLPGDWFDPEKNPELMEYLRPKGKITKTATGFEVALDTETRYRKFRWDFDDFAGNQVEVTAISATDREDKPILPVENDLSTGKNNDVLEIAPADTITVTYNDERRLNEEKAILSEKLSSAFTDGSIDFMYEEVTLNEEGEPVTKLTKAVRIRKGDTVMVEVRDPDEDVSEERETVKVEVSTSSGEKLTMELLETQKMAMTGTFREILKMGDVTDPSKNMLKIVPGDRITVAYLDKENNKPGIPVLRKATLMNSETNQCEFRVYSTKLAMIEDKSPAALAKIKMMRDKGDKRKDIKILKEVIEAVPVTVPAKGAKTAAPAVVTVNSKTPLLFNFICPDIAKHAGSTADIEVLTQTEINAAKAEQRDPSPLIVKCALTDLTMLARQKGYQVKISKGNAAARDLLRNGVFSGIVRFQLGSPGDEINDVVTNNDSFNLLNAGQNSDMDAFKVPTVIVSGSDKVTLTYRTPEGKELASQTVQLRSDGELELYDKNYLTVSRSIHLGQNFFIRVYDPDRDVTDERDTVTVNVAAGTGDKVTLKLEETLPHSGIFTGPLKAELKPKPIAGQTEPKKLENNILWTNFGDKVTFTYVDDVPLTASAPETLTVEGDVVIGSDGEVSIFTKKFKDPEMAVKTNFLMAEALFEMAKSHRAMKDKAKEELAKEEIAKGKRVLEEALRDYPNTTLKAQGDFLLANLAQQLEKYNDAIGLYSSVLARYPQSEYAVKSQFQKAVCLEKLNQFIPACEEYVKLTYLYPNDKLAADAKLRLANHYYKQKNYKSAAQIFRRFAENHKDHALASSGMMLAGYSAVKFEEQKIQIAEETKMNYTPDYTLACTIFQELVEMFPDDKKMRPEAMYWLGDLWFKGTNTDLKAKSYQILQNLIWDYPETRWAKLARGRLAERPKN